MCRRISNTLKVFLFALFMGFLSAAVSTADPNGGTGHRHAQLSGIVKLRKTPGTNANRIIV